MKISKIKIGERYRKDIGDLTELKNSITEQGLLQPVGITKDNELVFGQRRIEACKELGYTEIEVVIVDVTSLVEGEHDENEIRKEFVKSERKAIADKVKEIIGNRQGQRTDQLPHRGAEVKGKETRDVVTEKAGFKSREEYRRVTEVVNHGSEELVKAMDEDIIDVTNAAKLAKQPKEKQLKVIKKAKEEKISASEAIKEIKKEERKLDIAAQRKEIEKGVKKPTGKYDVIVLDPPWAYEDDGNYDPETRRGTTPYPTMSQAELLKMELPSKSDSVVFLWTTHKHIWNAKELLDAYGFEYKATMVWDKGSIGTGVRFRYQCEFCLVGIKGKPFWNNNSHSELIHGKRREHSRKPDSFYELVEEITAGERLDYFSREPRKGWVSFGNDVDKFGGK